MESHEPATYPAKPTSPRLLTVDEVAERLTISPATVYRLIAARELHKIRIGGSTRFREADVEALIERGAGP